MERTKQKTDEKRIMIVNSNSLCKDGIVTDILKDAAEDFHKGLAQLFTTCIQNRKLS